ncbi:2-C-methyl-D-erythritol 2,4-cyclodiphosphate synthase [Desulfococcus multivorans]|uniref:2-C-methyl-D-erythritol 2,4-cyclodiphosphate synthase n=1 Tax=Desulfococcus multivorans DSM 2059 TaxID=1121405 RepID=S7UY20_DESML|nr:2-C-methyl-D-erythritol 2,4-cyclodiphosphate synthase [Desulfococcus multivorans]AOY58944.1 IspF: 2-C-methyl-D-erythritol 2,4-cyclodiphosphate synthase (MECPS) [Desulfococcus multivorans]AQV01212.1 2-C-methyl-D-erythritol 2,4-cyclodiphosphate synthase [Desulfococcus multivorans]EPR39149.1 2-C-methyl-D-erythritol 2,4-cyclodiphosphate synthase [Desulfococcus multivorans DSM 2059]SJZ53805.1 2-C-methyl-D-erythritol 2,4-cyclodiphosphate synthase [Desulfococcus multivorans DSM 2059]
MRIGMGHDVHQLVRDRKLVIGGVTIPFERGLLGHSDADVLLHAICDALLGAAGLGDIGRHFPDTDPSYKNIDSIRLLIATHDMVRSKGLELVNLDATIFAEAPRMAPFRPQMIRNIASALGVPEDRVNVKATTTEGLGAVGRGEGIAATSVVLLQSAMSS